MPTPTRDGRSEFITFAGVTFQFNCCSFLPSGAPARYGLFGRTTASLLWDLAKEKKGCIECAPISGFVRGEATAWVWGAEGSARTFDAQGRDVTVAASEVVQPPSGPRPKRAARSPTAKAKPE